MADMMKMHEQMMAEMKAGDAKLDALIKDMNAATGDAEGQCRRGGRRGGHHRPH
jgi:hypothetical protein